MSNARKDERMKRGKEMQVQKSMCTSPHPPKSKKQVSIQWHLHDIGAAF